MKLCSRHDRYVYAPTARKHIECPRGDPLETPRSITEVVMSEQPSIDQKLDRTISFRVDDVLYSKLKVIASDMGVSLGTVVRDTLQTTRMQMTDRHLSSETIRESISTANIIEKRLEELLPRIHGQQSSSLDNLDDDDQLLYSLAVINDLLRKLVSHAH